MIPDANRDEWESWLRQIDFRLRPRPTCAKELQTTCRNVTFTDPVELVPL
jgi:hypothetical protein